jgi:hypothetical protein
MMSPAYPLESVSQELDRIVAERRRLREAGAAEAQLEANRQRLRATQGKLTQLLVEHHLGQRN